MTVLPASAPAQAAATELLRQHAARETFAALAGELAPTDTEAAYRIQDRLVTQLLQQRKTSLAGYKIAITTPAMRDMVGFQDSVAGRLLRDQMHRSGDTIHARDHVRLIVEFEIAFEMARDLPPAGRPWTGAAILDHVACAYPALEIADDRQADYPSLKQSVLTLVADNAWNQGLVLGAPVKELDAAFLQAVEGIAFIDGREVGRGTGRDVLGHPLDALAWLANHLVARGLPMNAGDIVTTGSLVKSQFPVAGNRIEFRLPGFGQVHLAVD
jgi:2-keto-4-pentenoate hydratase